MIAFLWNTKLRWNTTLSLLDNYMLKCDQHMLHVFSTENLSAHHKILIGIRNQFDLHKHLYIFYENKTCTLRLGFLLMCFFSTSLTVSWTNYFVILTKEEEYLIRHLQSNGVNNPCVGWVLSRGNLLVTKINWCFLCLVNIFYYLENSPLWPSRSCLLANCQLHDIA